MQSFPCPLLHSCAAAKPADGCSACLQVQDLRLHTRKTAQFAQQLLHSRHAHTGLPTLLPQRARYLCLHTNSSICTAAAAAAAMLTLACLTLLACRTFAFTHLNAHSSRSHAVVMLTVVKRRRYLTPAEKQAEKKAEREGVATQKV